MAERVQKLAIKCAVLHARIRRKRTERIAPKTLGDDRMRLQIAVTELLRAQIRADKRQNRSA